MILAAAGVLILFVASLAYSSRQAAGSVAALSATVSDARTHALDLNMAALASDLQRARQESDVLEADTSGPAWFVGAKLPVVGANFRAIRALADGLRDVLLSAEPLEVLLPSLEPSSFRTPDGRIDIDLLRRTELALRPLQQELARQRSLVGAISRDGLLEPVAHAVARAQLSMSEAPASLRMIEPMMGVLGAYGPRRYAVLLLNPAEQRGGGGFLGGWALVTADRGRITLKSVVSNDPLDAASRLDVSALPEEYRALWGASSDEWQSVNISPHFPYAAEMTVAGLMKLGVKVDGVIALDSKIAAALLAGTGPLRIGSVTITSKDADAYFTKRIYDQFPNGVGKDSVALGLFGKMFTQLTTGTVDVKAMASALIPLLGERRLLLWSSDQKEEAALSATPVSGQVPTIGGPWVTVALVNGAGNKMDAYVKARVDYVAQRCGNSSAASTMTLGLLNVAPGKLPPYVDQRLDDPTAPRGSTMSLGYVYGPVGSVLKSATLDGKTVPVQAGSELGHPVWRFDIAILRGQTRKLVVSFTEPPGSSDQKPVVMAQPMAIPEVTTATLAPCAA